MQNSIKRQKKGIEVDIEGLKKKLNHGHFTKIALKVKKSPQCIGKQFNGKTKRVKNIYIQAALEVLKEEQEETIKTNQLINQI